MLSALVLILVGLFPLFFGRRLFWLMVGVVGFSIGLNTAFIILDGQSQWLQLLVGLLVGMIFAGLAIALQKPMFMVAGFLALASLGVSLGTSLNGPTWAIWILAFGLGLIGLMLVYLLIDWALIVISAGNGAAMVSSGLAAFFTLPGIIGVLLIILLLAAGIWYQSRDLPANPAVAA